MSTAMPGPLDEGGFQQAFAAALLARSDADAPGSRFPLSTHPAFAVYRNTVLRGCVEALEANYPCTARLVGATWFHGAALHYATRHPPDDGRLMVYGTGFPGFLASLPSAAELPYLEGVALLDQSHREALAAADATACDPAWLAHCAPEALATVVLQPHPATRWHWFASAPVAAIWCREREQVEGAPPPDADNGIAWQGDGALFTRPGSTVFWQAISAAACAFLDACAAGYPLAEAAEAALRVDNQTDLAALLQQLLVAGAFQHNRNTP